MKILDVLFRRKKKSVPGPLSDGEILIGLRKVIADRLEIYVGKVTLESSFREDLGADSLDSYEILYAIEEKFGISIPDEKAGDFQTVGQAFLYLKARLEKKEEAT